MIKVHKCFKFYSLQTQHMSVKPQCNGTAFPLPTRKDLEKVKESFTERKQSAKLASLLHSDSIRTGFQ